MKIGVENEYGMKEIRRTDKIWPNEWQPAKVGLKASQAIERAEE